MKRTELIMGMPITIEIIQAKDNKPFTEAFNYFRKIDEKFSPYKQNSELSQINRGLDESLYSKEMKDVLRLCEDTKKITNGYFDINNKGTLDTSGLVKGWSIDNAARLIHKKGFKDFYIEAGGDIQAVGLNEERKPWAVGIRNPFNIEEIVKVVNISNLGVATSGTYLRGEHIYNPKNTYKSPKYIKSLTVIGPDVFEADRFATAAFAMGQEGIMFIDAMPGFEAYMIDDNKVATYTKGFNQYVA